MYIYEFPDVHLRFSECTLRKSWMRTQEFLSAHLENSECASVKLIVLSVILIAAATGFRRNFAAEKARTT